MPFLLNHTSDDLRVPELAFFHLPQLIAAGEQIEITDDAAARFVDHPCFTVIADTPPEVPAVTPAETAVTVEVTAGQHVELVPDTQGVVA